MLFLDWKFTLADGDLRKVGRMCELAGVDVRYPWLDDDVVEFSTTLGADDKVNGLQLRFFAKQALRGFLPDKVIDKPKQGFGLPFGEWLKTSPRLQEQTYALLTRFAKRGICRQDFLTTLVENHRTGHADYFGTMVWVLTMLEAWLEAHQLDL
jgi:asparagine synthase (glutamine-hydrolysing)